jgi:hypothetical protein
MITNSRELWATLRYFTSMTDALTALYLDAKAKEDFTLFPVVAEAYFTNICQLGEELKEYLQKNSDRAEEGVLEPKAARGEAA